MSGANRADTPARKRRELSVLAIPAIGLCVCALEVVVVRALLAEPPREVFAVSLHGATVLALLALTLFSCRRGWPEGLEASTRAVWLILLTVAVALTGLVGAVAALAGIAVYLRFKRGAMTFSEWYGQLFPEEQITLADRIHDELTRTLAQQQQDGSQVVPFMDVMMHGSGQQKMVAIAMMSRKYQPAFSQPLRQALKDSDSGVRVQAATAIANVEDRFLAESISVDAQVADDPSPEVLLAAGSLADRYAFSGLLDEDRERRNRVQALERYRQYLEHRPDDMDARVAMGRLLLRNGDADEACAVLEKTYAAAGSSARLNSWYMEALYRTKRYGELRRLASEEIARGHDETHLTGPVRDSAALWAGVSLTPLDGASP